MADTTKLVGDILGKEQFLGELEDQDGWITFNSPCIVKFLTGDRYL